jgi:DNA-binding transcriptional regulator YiaG
MQENNLTNQALAEMLDVSVTTVKNWKKKKSCPSYQLWQATLHGIISAVLTRFL